LTRPRAARRESLADSAHAAEPLADWVLLNMAGVGAVGFKNLLEAFGSAADAAHAPVDDLCAVPFISAPVAQRIHDYAHDPGAVEQMLQVLADDGIQALRLCDPMYPRRLAALHDAPPVLYVRGALPPEGRPAVALVGTRQPDECGREWSARAAEWFAQQGCAVISGLARGIDTAAHEGTVAGGGVTIACLGGSIDRLYPPENYELADAILVQGALVSEQPPGTQALTALLMARNRTIAGLSDAVIVVQTRSRGGAIETARRAVKLRRAAYAVRWETAAEFDHPARDLMTEGAKALDPTEDLQAVLDAITP